MLLGSCEVPVRRLTQGLRTLFWTTTDLQEKLLDFQHYYNEHRTHAGRQGQPPETGNADRPRANLSCYRWQKHCGGLYQTPIAA